MANKFRDQNVVIGDTVQLQLFVFNSNNLAALDSVDKVEIYYLDPTARVPSNPDGRTLVQTYSGINVVNNSIGFYELDVLLTDPPFQDGHFIDKWYVVYVPGDPDHTIDQSFQIYPDLWFTSPTPVLYSFNFFFQPNKLAYGSKQYLGIEIEPVTPTINDLYRYYLNLAIAADLKVSIAANCGDCLPCENDLRLLVDNDTISYRKKNRAYYFLDTTLFGCGIFDIWFTLNLGESTYISERNQIQIY